MTVLISGGASDSKSVAAMRSMVIAMGETPVVVCNHLEMTGGDPARIQAMAAVDIGKVSGVIVMGSNADIEPSLYGAVRHPKTQSQMDKPETAARAAYEMRLVQQAIARGVPTLGICGGEQIINTVTGGTLHQHVPDLLKNPNDPNAKEDNRHSQNPDLIAPYIPVELVKIEPDSMLASIGGNTASVYTPSRLAPPPGVILENSMHHQAVDRLGKGMRIAARSIEPDRPDVQITEAIEADPNGPYGKQFLVGVQWHPEFGASDFSTKLIKAFTEHSREYAQAHGVQADIAYAMQRTAQSIEPDKREKIEETYTPAPGSWAEYVLNRGRQQGRTAA